MAHASVPGRGAMPGGLGELGGAHMSGVVHVLHMLHVVHVLVVGHRGIAAIASDAPPMAAPKSSLRFMASLSLFLDSWRTDFPAGLTLC